MFFFLFCFDFDVTFGEFLSLSPSKKNSVVFLIENPLKMMKNAFHPVDKGRKLNVHNTFTRRPGRLLKVLCTFNVRPVSRGLFRVKTSFRSQDI